MPSNPFSGSFRGVIPGNQASGIGDSRQLVSATTTPSRKTQLTLRAKVVRQVQKHAGRLEALPAQ